MMKLERHYTAAIGLCLSYRRSASSIYLGKAESCYLLLNQNRFKNKIVPLFYTSPVNYESNSFGHCLPFS